MKRLRKQERERLQRLDGTERGVTEAKLVLVVGGDLYLHNPRGSNDSSSSSGG